MLMLSISLIIYSNPGLKSEWKKESVFWDEKLIVVDFFGIDNFIKLGDWRDANLIRQIMSYLEFQYPI